MSRWHEEAENFQCIDCRWLEEIELVCKAFPSGIPREVLLGEVLHDQVLPYQQGEFIYEKLKK